MITENGLWNLNRIGKNHVQFASMYTWKRNFWIDATLHDRGFVVYDNPKNVPIPNYVRKEVFKMLTYGASFYHLVKMHRGFMMSLTLNMENTNMAERPSYDYDVQTIPFVVRVFDESTKLYQDISVYSDGVNFTGTQYAPAPSILGDKDAILDDLLFWLCVRPGDTDRSFFDRYTPEQMEWTQSWECEEISADLPDD